MKRGRKSFLEEPPNGSLIMTSDPFSSFLGGPGGEIPLGYSTNCHLAVEKRLRTAFLPAVDLYTEHASSSFLRSSCQSLSAYSPSSMT